MTVPTLAERLVSAEAALNDAPCEHEHIRLEPRQPSDDLPDWKVEIDCAEAIICPDFCGRCAWLRDG